MTTTTNMYEYYNSSFVIAPSSRTPTNYQKFGFESNLYDTETEKTGFLSCLKHLCPG